MCATTLLGVIMRKDLRSVALGVCLMLAGITGAQAIIITPTFVKQGNYNDLGSPTTNILTSGWDVASGSTFRQYSVFDLGPSGVSDTINSASLKINLADSGYISEDDIEPISVYNVGTDPLDLGLVTDPNIFNDLGSGAVYGSQSVGRPDPSPPPVMEIVIDLSAAISQLQSATGQFAFGLALTDLRFDDGSSGPTPDPALNCIFFIECSELLFLSETEQAVLELDIAGGSVIPGPAPLALLVFGFAGLPLYLRRKRQDSLSRSTGLIPVAGREGEGVTSCRARLSTISYRG